MRWALAAVGFVGSVVLANALTSRYGFVPVGFGFTATAGTYAAGLTLAVRDVADDIGGRWFVAGLIAAGVALSLVLADPRIALASGVAFAVSELADWSVYRPLRDRSWSGAVAASNVVGAVIDTALFVGLAFGVARIGAAMPGQLIAKATVTAVFLALAYAVRTRRAVVLA